MSARKEFKSSTIRSIFVNLLFLIGVILLIIGFVGGTSTVVKLFVFDKYPLNSYEETRCEMSNYPVAIPEEKTPAKIDEAQKQICLEGLEKDRKLRLVEDVTQAISFTVAGIFLTLVFKGFIFEKKDE